MDHRRTRLLITEPDPGADGSDPVGNGKITNYMIEKSIRWIELV